MVSGPIRLPILQAQSNLMELEPFLLPSSPFVPGDVPPIQFSGADLAQRTELRTSSYTIYIDLPDNPDEMLLVHAYTGAYDRTSKRVATYLRSLETHHAPKPLYGDWTPEPRYEGSIVKPSDETIATLKRRGYLVPLTPEEEEALFVKLSAKLHFRSVRRSPNYILMPTYQCNLRCPYCFQDHMRTDPSYGHLLRIMDRATADRIIKGMRQIEAVHGIAEDADLVRSITFFGGEPLLAESRPIVEHFITELRKQSKVRFSAISNATELEAYRDLLGKDLIAQIQVTLDGPPAEHDRRRIYPDGSGSFERIAANIDMALDLGVRISVRMNIDRNNIDQLPALAEEFYARKWIERENFSSYVAPITGDQGPSNSRTTFTSWQLGRALEERKRLHPRMAHIGITDDALQQQARQIFEGQAGSGSHLRTSFCGAHTTMYVIDAFADIYACWEHTGDPKIRIGHINESGGVLMNRAILEKWRGRNIVSNPVCRKCRYATSCGGGCAALAEETSGDAYTNYCDGYAKRFRASVAESYLKHLRGERAAVGMTLPCDL